MRNLRSNASWACSFAAIIILAVLTASFLGREKTETITAENGKILAASMMDKLSGQRLRFIANHGQAGADALYHVQGAGHTVLFYENKIVLRRAGGETESNEVRLQFEGASFAPVVEGRNQLPGVAHFYKGQDPDNWQTNVPTFGSVFYRDLYPGIDMAYIGDDGALESEFYLEPGADYRQIRLNYKNVRSRTIRDDGALVLDTSLGELVEKAPVAYQEIGGDRVEIDARYILFADETIGFELGNYDLDYEVVIDPELVFLVSFGASIRLTSARGVVIDTDGNVIFAGGSNLTFPVNNTIAASNDASISGLLMKLEGTTGDVLFSALFGGTGIDEFNGLTTDQEGNLYLTGYTESDDFPIMNAAQGTRAGGSDAFLTILTSDAVLTYSTYLGGSDFDEGRDVTLDGIGNVFVGGNTASADFPVTAGAFQQLFKGGSPGNPFSGDFFVAKYNASGGVGFATYLGGQVGDRVCNIVANASGQVTITGVTASVDFPVANAFQSLFGGGGFFGGDITVSRLNSAGDGLIYSTYFGGASSDDCSGIALGPNDDVFVSGSTMSEDFPVIGGTSTPEAGVPDGILLMLDNTGQPVYSIRSNIAGDDTFGALAVDESSTAVPVSQQGAFIKIYGKTLVDPLAEIFSFDAAVQHRVNAAYLARGQMAVAGDFLPAAGKGASSGASTTEAWAALSPRLPLIYDIFNEGKVLVEQLRETVCPAENINTSWSFLSPTRLFTNDRIRSGFDISFDYQLPAPAYVGYIQCDPSLQYASPGAVILIPTEQPQGELETVIFETDGPLAINMQYRWRGYIERLESPDRLDPNGSSIIEIQDSNTIEDPESTTTATPRVCAILITGEPNGEAEKESFETNQAIFKANLMGEKLGPRLDETSIVELISPSGLEILDAIEATKGKYDEVYVFYSGHGWKIGLGLSENELFPYGSLSRALYETEVPKINVVLDACHSGASIKHFKNDARFKKRDVTVLTAASTDKSGYGQNLLDENGDVVQWGMSFGFWLMKGFGNPDADADGDGGTSLQESFEWMREQDPVIKKKGFITEGNMNEVSDPQILTNETKKATSEKISFSDADIEMILSTLDPNVNLSVAMSSGLDGNEREEASVTALSEGRHWIIEATGQAAVFFMDILVRYEPIIDFVLDPGVVPGLAVRPIQNGSGKNATDPWQAYLPTVWDPESQTITAIGVMENLEWAIALTVGASAVSTEPANLVPVDFGLLNNYPNPFRSSTSISYDLPKYSDVRITVFDAVGRVVKILVDEEQTAGRRRINWDGRSEGGIPVASGTYIVRLDTRIGSDSRILTLIR